MIAQDWLNLAGERGLSNFDQRHLLTLQAQYSTGMGVGGGTLMSGWRGALFKEWTFGTQITAGSGLPQTPIYVAAVQGTGVTGSIRPNFTGAPLYDAPSGLLPESGGRDETRAGTVGQCRAEFHHRSVAVLSGCIAGAHVPAGRPAQCRFPDRLVQRAQPPDLSGWNTNINNAQFGLPVSANKMRMARASVRVRF